MLIYIKHCIVYFSLLISMCSFALDKNYQGNQPERLKVGMLKLMTGGIINMAREKGFFSENNLELEIVTFESAQQVALAVAAGDIDIGQGGLTAAVYNLAGKGQLKIVAGSSREVSGWPGVAYMVSNKQWNKGVRTPSELKNVSLGITEKGSTLHYMAGLLADKYHFSLEKSMKLVPLGAVSSVKAALASGQVDSAIVPNVVAHKLVEEKHGQIIGYVGNETPWQVTGVFASARLLKQSEHLVEQFLAGFVKGCSLYHKIFNTSEPLLFSSEEALAKSPERDNIAVSIARFLKPKMDPVQISTFPVYMDPLGKIDLDSVNHQIKWYQDRGMVDKSVNVDRVIERRFIRRL